MTGGSHLTTAGLLDEQKQSVVARSTIEAKYRVIALRVTEMLWLKSLLEDLKVNHVVKNKVVM
jgi:hypothetical protein